MEYNFWINTMVTLICSVLASSGVWSFALAIRDRHDAKREMLIGLGHDRIIFLGKTYIQRGWITQEEYENLHDYLYIPYAKCGGNGSAKRIMDEVDKLPIR